MLIFKARRKDPTISHALTASERRVMKILGAAMQKVRAGTAANEDQIIDALRHLPVGKVVDLVPDQPWFDAQGEIEDELVKELVASGQRTGSSFPKIRKEVLTYRFDADRPEAAAWAKKESAKLVTEIIEDQRNTIRDFVSASQMGDFTVTQVARNLRDVVGLTTQQTGWVDNFRNRAISDRMANGETFEQASQRAAKETERYQQRIHRYRSETIARTEILRASSEGRNQAWQQGLADGYIDPDSQKQWVAEFDACEICSPLDGETVGISAEFPDGDPPLHPNCRCSLDLVDIDVSDFEDMSWEEIDAELDSLFGEQETDSETQPETPTDFLSTLNNEQKDRYYEAQLLGRNEEEAQIYATLEPTPKAKVGIDHFKDNDYETAREITGQWKADYTQRSDVNFGYKNPEDMMMKEIVKAQGFDVAPTVVSQEEFAVLREKGGMQYVGRGITGRTPDEVSGYVETFKDGNLFTPRGMFGSGTYGSPNSDVLEHFSTMTAAGDPVPHGTIMNMLIKPDAKVLSYSEADRLTRGLTANRTGGGAGADDPLYLFTDNGRAAAAEGYDVIKIREPVIGGEKLVDTDYYIILNRGALIVEDTK